MLKCARHNCSCFFSRYTSSSFASPHCIQWLYDRRFVSFLVFGFISSLVGPDVAQRKRLWFAYPQVPQVMTWLWQQLSLLSITCFSSNPNPYYEFTSLISKSHMNLLYSLCHFYSLVVEAVTHLAVTAWDHLLPLVASFLSHTTKYNEFWQVGPFSPCSYHLIYVSMHLQLWQETCMSNISPVAIRKLTKHVPLLSHLLAWSLHSHSKQLPPNNTPPIL